jgi:uncharacterized protein
VSDRTLTSRDATERHVRGFFEAMDAGDFDRVAGYFDENTRWVIQAKDLPGAGTHVGWTAISKVILGDVRATLFEDGDPQSDIYNVLIDGDRALVEFVGRGRLRSGKDYENTYAFCFELDGEVFRTVREYMDSHYVATTLLS